MRIESFWARGFRSLRDVRIDGLGAFNVFYGRNGSGKSNLLAAMEAWLRLIPIALDIDDPNPDHWRERGDYERGDLAYGGAGAPVQSHDLGLHSVTTKLLLGGVVTDLGAGVASAQLEVELDAAGPPTLHVTRLVVDGLDLGSEGTERTDAARKKGAAMDAVPWGRKLSLISADRMPRIEAPGERPPADAEPLSWYFRRGRLKDALFAAQNATSPATARSLEQFREFMAGPPLHRPPFRTVEDPHTGVRDLRERLSPPLEGREVSLDLAGLGIAQIYWILGQAMLSGAAIVGIEEPEAHLHAPTTGLDLRVLLGRLVGEKHLDQVFIATHSNLFDLDPTGFFEVRLERGETLVTRKPLDAIDEHFYEPGPTLHALEELLEIAPADKVMFRRPDGTPVTASEMVRLLRAADPTALDYLKNLHAAAVDVVGLRSRRANAS